MAGLPRPEGHHTLTPGASVPQASDVIRFLEDAFDAKLLERFDGPDGSVAHAEVRIGDSVIMLGEPTPGTEPKPAMLAYYVDDGPAVDATYARALECGATSVTEPQDQFYGLRSATVTDVGGNLWSICAVIEQLTTEEIERRMADMMQS